MVVMPLKTKLIGLFNTIVHIELSPIEEQYNSLPVIQTLNTVGGTTIEWLALMINGIILVNSCELY